MHIIHINGMDLHPPILRHVIQIIDTTTHGIAMTRMVNGALAEINGLFDCQIRTVICVQHTIGVRRSRSDREVPPVKTRSIVIDVIQLRTRLIPPRNHRPHTQSISAVRTGGGGGDEGKMVRYAWKNNNSIKHLSTSPGRLQHDLPHGIREQLRCRRYSNALLIPQLVHAALHAQVPFPERTIGRAARHRPQKEGVDFDDLLDGAGGDVRAHGGAGVDAYDYPAVPFEG